MSLPATAAANTDRLITVHLHVSEFTPAGGRLYVQAGAVAIETPATAGDYGAQLCLPAGLQLLYGSDPALVQIRLKVDRGAVAIGLLDRSGTAFLDRKELNSSEDRTLTLALGVRRLWDASSLVLFAGPGGGRARVEAVSLSVHSTVPPDRLRGVDLPLSDFVALAGRISTASGRVVIDTPAQPGAYAAQLALPAGLQQFYSVSPALIRGRVILEEGSVGIGVLNRQGAAFLDRKELSASEQRPLDVVLGIRRLGDSSTIVLVGGASGAGRARFEALSLEVYSMVPADRMVNVDLPLNDFVASAGRVNVGSGPAIIDTPAVPGDYGAQLMLPGGLQLVYPGEPALVSVRLRVEHGAAGIGLLNRDGTAFLDRRELGQGDAGRTVYFGVPNVADASSLVVYGGLAPAPARLHIQSVAISL